MVLHVFLKEALILKVFKNKLSFLGFSGTVTNEFQLKNTFSVGQFFF